MLIGAETLPTILTQSKAIFLHMRVGHEQDDEADELWQAAQYHEVHTSA